MISLDPQKKKLKKKEKKENKTHPLCILYILTGAWSRSQYPPLNRTETSPPTYLPKTINYGELHFSISFTLLRVFFSGFLSMLLPFVVVCVGRYHISSFFPPSQLCVCSHPYHSKSSLLVFFLIIKENTHHGPAHHFLR